MFTKKSTVNENDLVLMETKNLEEKCGKCNNHLTLNIYYTREEGYLQKIICNKCGLAIWKTPIKSE